MKFFVQKGWPPKCSKSTKKTKLLRKKGGHNSPGGLLKSERNTPSGLHLATVNITGRTSWGRMPPLYPSVDCRERDKEVQRAKEAKTARFSQTQRPFFEEDKNRRLETNRNKAGCCDHKGLAVAEKRGYIENANGVTLRGGPVTARTEATGEWHEDGQRSAEEARKDGTTDTPCRQEASGQRCNYPKLRDARRGKCWQFVSGPRNVSKKRLLKTCAKGCFPRRNLDAETEKRAFYQWFGMIARSGRKVCGQKQLASS